MKLCTVSYHVVNQRHPVEVAAIITALRKGKSIHRNADPSTLIWDYEYCVRHKSYSIQEIAFGYMLNDKAVHNAMSTDDKIQDRLKHMEVVLRAKIGRWWGAEQVSHPPEAFDAASKWMSQYDT